MLLSLLLLVQLLYVYSQRYVIKEIFTTADVSKRRLA